MRAVPLRKALAQTYEIWLGLLEKGTGVIRLQYDEVFLGLWHLNKVALVVIVIPFATIILTFFVHHATTARVAKLAPPPWLRFGGTPHHDETCNAGGI